MDFFAGNRPLGPLLERLHKKSETEVYAAARDQFKGSDEDFHAIAARFAELPPHKKGEFLDLYGISIEDPALSLAIEPDLGRFLFSLSVAQAATSILELGSSDGISTLYFAEALRVRGNGRVTATELDPAKCANLKANAIEAGLFDYIDLREDDVFKTISDLQGPFDIVFIDIWSSGYLNVFKAIETILTPGTIVLADNMYTAHQQVRDFKAYLDGKNNVSNTTLPFGSGLEFAVMLP